MKINPPLDTEKIIRYKYSRVPFPSRSRVQRSRVTANLRAEEREILAPPPAVCVYVCARIYFRNPLSM